MFSFFSRVVGCTVEQGSVKRISPLAFTYVELRWVRETGTRFDIRPHANPPAGESATNAAADTRKTNPRNVVQPELTITRNKHRATRTETVTIFMRKINK